MILCYDKLMDNGDPVCGVHGHLWPDGKIFCNAIGDDVRKALEFAWDSGYWQGVEQAIHVTHPALINAPRTNPFKED